MLILKRFQEERVIITTSRGERIEIMVTDFHSAHGRRGVSLGITAPKEITIHREEVEARIRSTEA